jgi:mono/diheme cytochrome c family protein
MKRDTLYGITALFESPDDIIHAAEEVVSEGYTRFDVNTPYPVHGMDGAMKLKPSRVGFFALAFGLLGAISAVVIMTWVTLVDYPLVIGGKPFWSWPAFVPIAFEITVLLASVLSVVSMIVVYFRFPNLAHPLHDTPYMKRVSSDRFGICIQADDPRFNETRVGELLKKAGGGEITSIYFEEEEPGSEPKLFDPKFLGLLLMTAVATAGITYFSFNVVLTWEPFSWMNQQARLDAQEPSTLFQDGAGMRPPVEGTVARGFLPYAFAGKPDEAGKYLRNPLLPTERVLQRGKVRYLTFCSPCHGNFGRGNSRLQGQFPNPPTLHSDKARTLPDGSIYHVITQGQNVMPGYSSQVSREDRWAIVHYVRVLQRAHNANESDLK